MFSTEKTELIIVTPREIEPQIKSSQGPPSCTWSIWNNSGVGVPKKGTHSTLGNQKVSLSEVVLECFLMDSWGLGMVGEVVGVLVVPSKVVWALVALLKAPAKLTVSYMSIPTPY